MATQRLSVQCGESGKRRLEARQRGLHRSRGLVICNPRISVRYWAYMAAAKDTVSLPIPVANAEVTHHPSWRLPRPRSDKRPVDASRSKSGAYERAGETCSIRCADWSSECLAGKVLNFEQAAPLGEEPIHAHVAGYPCGRSPFTTVATCEGSNGHSFIASRTCLRNVIRRNWRVSCDPPTTHLLCYFSILVRNIGSP